MTAAIETTELAKTYGSTVALAALSMRVERGEVFGFLGPNGAGKTTAVKLLLGLARRTGGTGSVLGAPLGDRRIRAKIGYLPEQFRYQPWLRADEVIDFHRRLSGVSASDPRTATPTLLASVGLASRRNDHVGTFSKGMQQRLGLAVALVGSPDLVVLDEPTSALDPVGRSEVRVLVRAIADRGATVFLNSHLLTEVERVCDRVAIVDRGRIVAAGRPDDLVEDSGVRIVVSGLDAPADVAARFGSVDEDGVGLRVGCRPDDVSDLVAALVAAGGRVHAVEPLRTTLEDRFLALVAPTHVSGT
ncbi:MAG TPA: ABC transporter ATP-binding protein [Candidatus Limnocylindrales bacterium]|nr:ABC transporter ATP-binding protein [Candidatus Limnocylindrales bacterium]